MNTLIRCFLIFFSVVCFNVLTPAFAEEQLESVAAVQQVDINTADAELIAEMLSGVGLKKAQAIVSWREKNGKFSSIEQLTEVKGIGESTVAKNQTRIRLN